MKYKASTQSGCLFIMSKKEESIMEIIIKALSRELVSAYSDIKLMHVGTTNQYDVEFLIVVDGETIESNLTIEHVGDISFDKAKELIKEKFSKSDKE